MLPIQGSFPWPPYLKDGWVYCSRLLAKIASTISPSLHLLCLPHHRVDSVPPLLESGWRLTSFNQQKASEVTFWGVRSQTLRDYKSSSVFNQGKHSPWVKKSRREKHRMEEKSGPKLRENQHHEKKAAQPYEQAPGESSHPHEVSDTWLRSPQLLSQPRCPSQYYVGKKQASLLDP